jgi:hypothetical protein
MSAKGQKVGVDRALRGLGPLGVKFAKARRQAPMS